MSSAHEKTLPKQLTAQELAEGERLSLERQKNGHERSVEEYLSKVESFVHRASKPELLKFITGETPPRRKYSYHQQISEYPFRCIYQCRKTKVRGGPIPSTKMDSETVGANWNY